MLFYVCWIASLPKIDVGHGSLGSSVCFQSIECLTGILHNIMQKVKLTVANSLRKVAIGCP